MQKNVVTLLLLILIVVNNQSIALAQQGKKVASRVDKNISNRVEITGDINGGNLPYVIEIDDKSAARGEVITLAANALTVFRCPETPLNIAFGNDIGIDRGTFKDGAPGFYLRPTLPGLFTNIVVEFPSGPVSFFVRVLAIKDSARVGDFHGEVIIKGTLFINELAAARNELKKVHDENSQLKESVSRLTEKNNETMETKFTESDVEVLGLLEKTSLAAGKNEIEVKGRDVRIRQLNRATRTERGWIVLFAVENKSKVRQSLSEVRFDNGKLISTLTEPRNIAPQSETRIALLIEPADGVAANMAITFVVSGIPIAVKVQG